MAIWAYGGPGEDLAQFAYDSLQKGISRFFYSWTDKADLHVLSSKSWQDMDDEEKAHWSYGKFMLNIKPGDYVVHVNVPSWGLVTVGRVVSEYYYDKDMPEGHRDGRQCLKVEDVMTFDRNDGRVHQLVSSRMKLRGAHWQIYCEDEFFASLRALKDNPDNETNVPFMKLEADEVFGTFAEKIHNCNPGKKLEGFIAKALCNVPGVINVKENGSGWKSDNGADLIVTYTRGIAGYGEDEIMVVQVKSYEGEHWDTKAVAQICNAINTYNAASGLIITTAKSTDNLNDAIAKLSAELGKPVYLMAGQDTARFVIKYGFDLLS